MANIVGIVTQQDVQTGLTLRARVTSPKGHYTAYQDFPCVIKRVGMSDEQAVTTDLNTISNKLLANGADSIRSNITAYMPITGDNGTNVDYTVNGPNIKEYIDERGVVSKRPAYGEDAIMGSLTITVSKNAAIATRDIGIIIEPYTSEELMQEAISIITWDNIRGQNATESDSTDTNGMFNVIYPLNLMKTIKTDLVAGEVTVNWSITKDELYEMLGNEYRIDLDTGAITRPAYMDIYKQKGIKVNEAMLDVITSKAETTTGDTYYRIGGLVLTASISIVGLEESQAVSFNLKTISSALTDMEVQEYLETNISKFKIVDTAYGNTEFAKSTLADTTEYDVYYDTTGVNASNLKLYSKSDMESATRNNDFTNSPIKINAVSWSVIDSSTLNSGGEGSSLPSHNITAAGALPTSGGILTLNPSNDPDNNGISKVVLRAVINITDYAGKPTQFVKADYWFKLNNATAQIPEEPIPDPDDPDDGQQTT